MRKSKKSILIFLSVILLFSSMVFGKDSCGEIFTQSDINSLCTLFVSDVKKGDNNSLIIEKVKTFVFNKIKIGEKRVLKNSDKCYKLEGVKIDLFYENKNSVKIDKLLSFGKTDSSTITVKSCQHSEKENNKNIFAEVSVHIFWAPSESELILSSDKNHLSLNETSEVRVKIKCGDCYLSGKKIKLYSTPSGEISPEEVITDKNGIATAVFKLKESSSAKLTASYNGLESSIIFNPAQLIWNLEIIVNHKRRVLDDHYFGIKFEKPQPVDISEYQYKVKFENIPLNRYIKMALNYPIINSMMKMAPIGTPINAKSLVDLKIKTFKCDCMTYGSCENCHWEEKSYNGFSKSSITFGLPLGKIQKPESLIISFIMGSVIETGNKQILFNLDPAKSYIKQNNIPDFSGKFTMPVYIPFDKIKALQPFSINYTFSIGKNKKSISNTARTLIGTWDFIFKFYPVNK